MLGNVKMNWTKIIMIWKTIEVAEKRVPPGPTGETVWARVAQLRGAQKLSYTDLARRCEDVGRSIPVLGLRRIEADARRVDVDDLMALAAALNVSPATLLMPDVPANKWLTPVQVTGQPNGITAQQLWAWLTAVRPPSIPALNERVAALRYNPGDYAMYQRDYVDWVMRAWPSGAPIPFAASTSADPDHGDN